MKIPKNLIANAENFTISPSATRIGAASFASSERAVCGCFTGCGSCSAVGERCVPRQRIVEVGHVTSPARSIPRRPRRSPSSRAGPGTLSVSIASRHAASASARCGAETAITTDVSADLDDPDPVVDGDLGQLVPLAELGGDAPPSLPRPFPRRPRTRAARRPGRAIARASCRRRSRSRPRRRWRPRAPRRRARAAPRRGGTRRRRRVGSAPPRRPPPAGARARRTRG